MDGIISKYMQKENERSKINALFYYISVFLITFFISNKVNSQNIYDLHHSEIYSQYLYETKQYSLAAEEMEKLLYSSPGNDTLKFQLVKCYLLNNEYEKASSRMKSSFPDPVTMPAPFAFEYSKTLLSLELIPESKIYIETNRNLPDKDRLYLRYNSELLGNEWDKAKLTFDGNKTDIISFNPKYVDLMTQINTAKYKSPGLALGLSAVVPGLGKVYTKNWKDGLISFVFFGATSFQAYRGYKKYGPHSGFFFVYGTIATTFYLGNLYGSFKAANKFNDKVRKQIHSSIKTVFIDTL
jgi:hypothetical protein